MTVGLTDQFFMGDDVPNSDPAIAEAVKEEIDPTGVSYMVVGDLIIVGAQILVACQVVFEEKFVRRYEVIDWVSYRRTSAKMANFDRMIRSP